MRPPAPHPCLSCAPTPDHDIFTLKDSLHGIVVRRRLGHPCDPHVEGKDPHGGICREWTERGTGSKVSRLNATYVHGRRSVCPPRVVTVRRCALRPLLVVQVLAGLGVEPLCHPRGEQFK